MPVSKTRRKKNGRPSSGGHFVFPHNPSQMIAFKVLGYGLIMMAVMVLSASSLNNMVSNDSLRDALTKRSANIVDGVRTLTKDQITHVFGVPSLQREEDIITVWHYASDICALDLYFTGQEGQYPEYAEYRVFTTNDLFTLSTKGAPNDTGHRNCVQDLVQKASISAVDGKSDRNIEQAKINSTRL